MTTEDPGVCQIKHFGVSVRSTKTHVTWHIYREMKWVSENKQMRKVISIFEHIHHFRTGAFPRWGKRFSLISL